MRILTLPNSVLDVTAGSGQTVTNFKLREEGYEVTVLKASEFATVPRARRGSKVRTAVGAAKVLNEVDAEAVFRHRGGRSDGLWASCGDDLDRFRSWPTWAAAGVKLAYLYENWARSP